MTKILLVEDNNEICICLQKRLEKENYLIKRAQNAREAYSLLNSSYDVLVIDGSEDIPLRFNQTLSEIVAEEYPNIKRIGISGEESILYSEIARQRYDCILCKPFDCQSLLKAIRGD